MFILCLFGCVYQMFNLNVIYFSYETTTNVKYETQSEPYLPAITLCYDRDFQLKDEFISNHTTPGANYLFTIKEHFTKLKPPSSRFGEYSIGPKIPSNGWPEMTMLKGEDNITQYISGNYYCFTYFSQINGEPDENYQVPRNIPFVYDVVFRNAW